MEKDDYSTPGAASSVWPALPLDAWRDTYATLHMWTQIVGKVRLALSPPVNPSRAAAAAARPSGCRLDR
jgi:hypothetical protein